MSNHVNQHFYEELKGWLNMTCFNLLIIGWMHMNAKVAKLPSVIWRWDTEPWGELEWTQTKAIRSLTWVRARNSHWWPPIWLVLWPRVVVPRGPSGSRRPLSRFWDINLMRLTNNGGMLEIWHIHALCVIVGHPFAFALHLPGTSQAHASGDGQAARVRKGRFALEEGLDPHYGQGWASG